MQVVYNMDNAFLLVLDTMFLVVFGRIFSLGAKTEAHWRVGQASPVYIWRHLPLLISSACRHALWFPYASSICISRFLFHWQLSALFMEESKQIFFWKNHWRCQVEKGPEGCMWCFVLADKYLTRTEFVQLEETQNTFNCAHNHISVEIC